MKLSLTRLLLINKRLFQTWSFLVLLALIPLTAFGLSRVSTAEKGILTIAVASEDEYLNQPGTGDPDLSSGTGIVGNPSDSFGDGAAAVVSRLQAETSLLRFTFFGTPEQAKEAAASGKADCAWIFCEGYEQNIAAAANGYPAVIVNVYAQSDTVFMKLAREKLFAAVYPDLLTSSYRLPYLPSIHSYPRQSADRSCCLYL